MIPDPFDTHRDALRRLDVRTPAWATLLATGLPLAGVLLLDWSVAAMLGFYWLESVVIGAFNWLRMLSARGVMIDAALERALANDPNATPEQRRQQIETTQRIQHAVMPGFFLLHYGLFCLVHAGVIAFLFDGAFAQFGTLAGAATIAVIVVQQAIELRTFRADAGFVALPRSVLMLLPYGRVFVLQLALLLCAIPALAGYSTVAALLLAAIKLAADLSGVLSLQRIFAARRR